MDNVTDRTPGRRWLKLRGALLGGLVALFALLCGCGGGTGGFSAEYGAVALYGALYSTFRIKGRVLSSATRLPIPAIRVTVLDPASQFNDNLGAATDAAGDYACLLGVGTPRDLSLTVRFEDVDGAANGAFASTDEVVVVRADDLGSPATSQATVEVGLDPQ